MFESESVSIRGSILLYRPIQPAILFDFIVLQLATVGRAGEGGMRGEPEGERMCVDNKFKYLDLFQPHLYLMVPICFD